MISTIASDLKITKAQREALAVVAAGRVNITAVMRGGHEFRLDDGYRLIRSSTLYALLRRGLVTWDEPVHANHYRAAVTLTEKGKVAL